MNKPNRPSLLPLTPVAEEPPGLVWSDFTDADGARIRTSFCPPPAGTAVKGHIILLPGFKEASEKYFEAVRDLHARGYAVWMMDWRGQGGSDRYLPQDPHKAHHLGYDAQVAALQQFIATRVVPGKDAHLPLHIIAHSMGGHITLRWLHDHNQPAADGTPGPVNSVMLSAPMLDINTSPLPKSLARQMARFARAAGTLENFIPGGFGWVPPGAENTLQKARNVLATSIDLDTVTSKLTSDPQRIGVLANWFLRKPELALGDPTYGWIYHTLRSVDILSQEDYLAAIKTPVLMSISGRERVVLKAASERAARLLPNCKRLDIPEARHEIWMERDELRNRWMKALDDFLALTGAAPAPKKQPPNNGAQPPQH